MTFKTIFISMAFIVVLAQITFAHGDEKHVPAISTMSAEEMFAAVQVKLTAIEQALAAKDLKAIHRPSDEAATMAEMLRDHIAPPPDKKERFDSAAKQLVEQLRALHAAADKGDQVSSESAFKKAKGAFKLVQTNAK